MFKRLTIVASVVAFGLMVSGCSKCGFWLEEWLERPAKSCKGDFPKLGSAGSRGPSILDVQPLHQPRHIG